MNTVSAKPAEVKERWYEVDAKDQVLGRLASRIATVLRGKHLPDFTPHVNMRTHVVVVNAAEVKLTGNKWDDKIYYRHTGWPGGIKSATARELQARKPGEILRKAVQGMLPKNRLGHATMTRLRIFPGPQHNHQAQKPESLDLHTREARKEE
jgi:large subunit ribosomal protein L13